MEEVKSTTIVPIGFYCFGLAVYFLSLAINVISSDKADLSSANVWVPVASFFILAFFLAAVGVGFLNLKVLCWRVLFFFLAICVSSMATFIIVFLFFLTMQIKLLVPYFQAIQTTSTGWFSFLGVFVSEIIVLYYLCSNEVVNSFGDMGPLVSPF